MLNEVPKIKLVGGHLDSSLSKDRKMCASSVPPEYILIERLKNVLYRLNTVAFLECWLGGGWWSLLSDIDVSMHWLALF